MKRIVDIALVILEVAVFGGFFISIIDGRYDSFINSPSCCFTSPISGLASLIAM